MSTCDKTEGQGLTYLFGQESQILALAKTVSLLVNASNDRTRHFDTSKDIDTPHDLWPGNEPSFVSDGECKE